MALLAGNGSDRGVVRPVAIRGRPHVTVVGPERVAHRISMLRYVVRPAAVRVLYVRRRRRQVDVVPHERRRALPEQRQIRRVVLQTLRIVRSPAGTRTHSPTRGRW